jgi:drug/metabolite transporter (DMT)-like permease
MNENIMKMGVNPLTIILISTFIAIITTTYAVFTHKTYNYKVFMKDSNLMNITYISLIIIISIIMFYSKIAASLLLKHHGTSTFRMLSILLNLLLGGLFIYIIKKEHFSNMKLFGYILLLIGSIIYSLN